MIWLRTSKEKISNYWLWGDQKSQLLVRDKPGAHSTKLDKLFLENSSLDYSNRK
jgi:hypothetical protein